MALSQPLSNQVRALFGYGNLTRKGFNFTTGVSYDFTNKILQSQLVQVSYNGSCCGLALEYRRINTPARVRTENRFTRHLHHRQHRHLRQSSPPGKNLLTPGVVPALSNLRARPRSDELSRLKSYGPSGATPRSGCDLTAETEYSILSSIRIPRRFTDPLRDKESTSQLEIAHVLFIDIVGYSKLPMDHQREQVEALQQVTSSTSEFTRAKSQEQLITLPTGDGMALVFFGSAEAPVMCSIELTQKLSGNPELKLRMGLHTGPVYRIADINANRNVSGGGINIAQRVMDCGDAGHILVSAALASVLKQVSVWSSALHDLGEVQVKHGVRVHVFNLLQDGVGNADTPAAVSRQRQVDGGRANLGGDKTRSQYRIGFGLGAATVAALLVATGFGIVRYSRRDKTTPFLSESAKSHLRPLR